MKESKSKQEKQSDIVAKWDHGNQKEGAGLPNAVLEDIRKS